MVSRFRRDGGLVGRALWGTAVPVDPGEHTVRASAPGKKAWESKAMVSVDTARLVVTLQELETAPVISTSADPSVPPPERRSLVPEVALAAVAVVGFGAGAGFLNLSAGKLSSAEVLRTQIVDVGHGCVITAANYDPRCPSLLSTARSDDAFHDVAVGAFIAGSAAAVSAVTYLLWPQRRAPSARGIPGDPRSWERAASGCRRVGFLLMLAAWSRYRMHRLVMTSSVLLVGAAACVAGCGRDAENL